MKIRKVSSVSVQISKFSEKVEESTTINVPWKERFRILLFGKLHIRIQKLPMMTFTVKKMKVVNPDEAD